MEVSGQLHSPGRFSPGERFPVPIVFEAGCALNLFEILSPIPVVRFTLTFILKILGKSRARSGNGAEI
jgi:hypothetical protein